MMAVAGVFVVALATALALTPAIRWLATRTGVVDRSDGKRKLHPAPVPLLGGVAVLGAMAAASLCTESLQPEAAANPWWLVSAACICLVGWCDDVWKLSPRWKLLGQVAAVLPLVATQWDAASWTINGTSYALGWWAAPLLLVWLLACINALNFLDGSDALASTCSAVAAAFIATIAEARGNLPVQFAAVGLCGALSGFLAFNVPPARIFLGDAGSMVIGLLLAILSLHGLRTVERGIDPVAMLLLLAVPLADMALAVARRVLSGRPFWHADRFHIHHRLLERGFSPLATTAILGGLGVLAGLGAWLACVQGMTRSVLLLGGVIAVALVRGGFIAHHEWMLVMRLGARLFVAAAARLGERTLGCDLPPREELAEWPFTRVWDRLRELVEVRSLPRLEVLAGRGTRQLWNDTLGPRDAAAENAWVLQLNFRSIHDGWCRMHAHINDDAISRPWQCLELLAIVRHFGAHWSENPERVALSLLRQPEVSERSAA